MGLQIVRHNWTTNTFTTWRLEIDLHVSQTIELLISEGETQICMSVTPKAVFKASGLPDLIPLVLIVYVFHLLHCSVSRLKNCLFCETELCSVKISVFCEKKLKKNLCSVKNCVLWKICVLWNRIVNSVKIFSWPVIPLTSVVFPPAKDLCLLPGLRPSCLPQFALVNQTTLSQMLKSSHLHLLKRPAWDFKRYSI